MLRFLGSELRPVLSEAKANSCRVIFVKDQGVYMMSEVGEKDDAGKHKILAYAVGCNPEVDDFDDWWELSRSELGGDDFGERFDVTEPVFAHIINSNDDLVIRATETHLFLEVVPPERPKK